MIAAVGIVTLTVLALVRGGSIPPHAILSRLRSFPLWVLAAALALGVLQNVLQSSRLWTLLPGRARLSWFEVFRSFSWGQLVNNYTPARAGDVVKVALIRGVAAKDRAADQDDTSAASLAGSVLLADKLADVGALLILIAVLIPGYLRQLHVPLPTSSPLAAGVALGAAGVALYLPRYRTSRAWRVAGQVLHGTSALWRLPQLFAALALGAAAWLTEALILIALTRSAGIALDPAAALGVLVVLNLGIAIPVSFANIGTFEAAAVFGLTRAGVPAAQAVAIALVHHVVQAGCVVLLASFTALVSRMKRGGRDFRVQAIHKRRALDHYDHMASHYNDSVGRGPLALLRSRERSAMLGFARFDDAAAHSVIDVGSGGGFYALEAKRAGKHVTAVDLAPAMVDQLRDKADEAWIGDVEQLEHDGRYDIVVCAGVLDFVLDPERAFANLARLTAPGGRLVVLAPRAAAGGLIYRFEKKLQHIEVNLFSLDWFQRAAAEHGLRVADYVHPLPTNRALLFERA